MQPNLCAEFLITFLVASTILSVPLSSSWRMHHDEGEHGGIPILHITPASNAPTAARTLHFSDAKYPDWYTLNGRSCSETCASIARACTSDDMCADRNRLSTASYVSDFGIDILRQEGVVTETTMDCTQSNYDKTAPSFFEDLTCHSAGSAHNCKEFDCDATLSTGDATSRYRVCHCGFADYVYVGPNSCDLTSTASHGSSESDDTEQCKSQCDAVNDCRAFSFFVDGVCKLHTERATGISENSTSDNAVCYNYQHDTHAPTGTPIANSVSLSPTTTPSRAPTSVHPTSIHPTTIAPSSAPTSVHPTSIHPTTIAPSGATTSPTTLQVFQYRDSQNFLDYYDWFAAKRTTCSVTCASVGRICSIDDLDVDNVRSENNEYVKNFSANVHAQVQSSVSYYDDCDVMKDDEWVAPYFNTTSSTCVRSATSREFACDTAYERADESFYRVCHCGFEEFRYVGPGVCNSSNTLSKVDTIDTVDACKDRCKNYDSLCTAFSFYRNSTTDAVYCVLYKDLVSSITEGSLDYYDWFSAKETSCTDTCAAVGRVCAENDMHVDNARFLNNTYVRAFSANIDHQITGETNNYQDCEEDYSDRSPYFNTHNKACRKSYVFREENTFSCNTVVSSSSDETSPETAYRVCHCGLEQYVYVGAGTCEFSKDAQVRLDVSTVDDCKTTCDQDDCKAFAFYYDAAADTKKCVLHNEHITDIVEVVTDAVCYVKETSSYAPTNSPTTLDSKYDAQDAHTEWYASAVGETCTRSCESHNRVCKDADLCADHERFTNASLVQAFIRFTEETRNGYSENLDNLECGQLLSDSKSAPYWLKDYANDHYGGCYISDEEKASNDCENYSCDSVRQDEEAYRVCHCGIAEYDYTGYGRCTPYSDDEPFANVTASNSSECASQCTSQYKCNHFTFVSSSSVENCRFYKNSDGTVTPQEYHYCYQRILTNSPTVTDNCADSILGCIDSSSNR
eukprot:gene261-475_t